MGILDFLNWKPSAEKFARIFIAFARKQGVDKPMKFDAAEFRIVIDGNKDRVFNLVNAYRDYCKVPKAERQTVLIKYTSGLTASNIPANLEEAKANILPTIKSLGQLEYVRLTNLLSGGASDTSIFDISIPFSDDAVVMLVYDTEHSMSSIGRTELQKWGLSIEEAMEIALGNLRDRTVDYFGELDDGVLVGLWGDSYESSRVLLSDVIYRSNVGYDPVFMIPSRGCFLITSSGNVAGQSRMVDYAREAIETDGRFVSAGMYRMREGRVVSYQSEDADVIRKLGELKRRNLAEDYASQKSLLEKLYEATGVDVFVATYTLVEKKRNHSLTTFCSWTKGVETALPHTDFVAMVVPNSGGKHEVKMVTWDDAMSIGGDLLTKVDGYPIRYRVSNFPSPEKLSLVARAEL